MGKTQDDGTVADPQGPVSTEEFDTNMVPAPDPRGPADQEAAIPFGIRVAAGWSWRVLAIAAASYAAFWLLGLVKMVVIPVFVAALLTALLAPFANYLTSHFRFPRSLSAAISLLVAVGAITALVFLVTATISDDVVKLGEKAVQGFDEVIAWLSTGPLNLEESAIRESIDTLQHQLSQNIDRIVTSAVSVGSSLGQIFAASLIAIFCLFFFLKDGDVIWAWIVNLFPVVAREKVDGAGIRSWFSLGAYTRTQIIVALVDGVGIGFGAYLLGVPLSVPLGVLVFLGAFIPIIGATVTGAVAVAVALVDSGIGTAVAMLVVVLLVQQLESNLLQPILMSRALSLHPVGVLLAVAAGAMIAGIIGALFAVPLVAILNTAIQYLNGNDPLAPDQRAGLAHARRRWRGV